FFVEVDALDGFEKAMHEVLARLLAVTDDVDAGVFLQLDGEHGGVVYGGREFVAFEPPLRPQPVRLGEPGRLRQAAGRRGGKQRRGGSAWHGGLLQWRRVIRTATRR